jgi:lipoprotein-anchoring transpeptidase ErfK/SrfK
MAHKSFIALVAGVTVLLVGAVAVYAYDSSRDDRIAKGVTVAGVDVGGMRVSHARAVVRRQAVPALELPVTVSFHGRQYRLEPSRARLRTDVDGMVSEALHVSRNGSIITRVARDVTGGSEHARVPAHVSYSPAAVASFVREVEGSVNRPARDARLDFPSLARVKEQDGRQVEGGQLTQRVERALRTPAPDRTVAVPLTVTHPKVTRDQLAARYPTLLVLDRASFKLSLYKHLKLARSFTVAVGQQGLETPAGVYHIQDKAVNPAWHVPNSPWAGSLAGQVIPGGTADNPLKARWLGIFAGAGIHGTDEVYSLGHAASHGCVRMGIPDVIWLYPRVPVGAPIFIG